MSHASDRAIERFITYLSDSDLSIMAQKIEKGCCCLIEDQGNRQIYTVATPKGEFLPVVYDVNKRIIVTVLPSKAIERIRKKQNKNANKINKEQIINEFMLAEACDINVGSFRSPSNDKDLKQRIVVQFEFNYKNYLLGKVSYRAKFGLSGDCIGISLSKSARLSGLFLFPIFAELDFIKQTLPPLVKKHPNSIKISKSVLRIFVNQVKKFGYKLYLPENL